ncbi:MAG: dockerin type I repeat-containing protein [Planctomycetota bacterium]
MRDRTLPDTAPWGLARATLRLPRRRLRPLASGAFLAVLVSFAGPGIGGARADELFVRGDANQDGYVTLSDVYAILRSIYVRSSLACADAADVDDDGAVTRIDAFALIGALFFGQSSLLKPYPAPGPDPTPDGLGCASTSGQAGGFLDDTGDAICDDPEGGAEIDFLHFRGELLVAPGETGIRVPVYITTAGDLEALSVSLYAPPELVRIERIDFSYNFLETYGLRPGWARTFDLQRDEGFLAATLALSLGSDLATLPEAQSGLLGHVEISIAPEAPVGTRTALRFRTTPARGPYLAIRNELSRGGKPQGRRLCGLPIEVVSGESVFLRGDANRDRRANVVDVVAILRWLFGSADGTLPCLDAADVNDDGRVSLTDAAVLATYLFRRGPAPVLPFPTPGRDDTEDALGCES